MERQSEFLTARELARRFNVSPETVRAWGRSGRIPTLRLSRKVVRYDVAAVMKALAHRGEVAQ